MRVALTGLRRVPAHRAVRPMRTENVMTRQSGPVVLQNAAAATGNGTALFMSGYTQATIQVTGTWSGTITFEATLDGNNWVTATVLDIGSTSRTHHSTTTTNGLFNADEYAGCLYFRARVSAYTSGSVTVIGNASE